MPGVHPTAIVAAGASLGAGVEIGPYSVVGAGVSVQWSRCCSVYAYYDGVLGRDNYNNNAVSGGVRISF